MATGTPAAYLYTGQLGTADAALYTASGSTKAFSNLFVVNTTASPVANVALSVHRNISGAVETICSGLSFPANSAAEMVYDVDEALEEITLEPGDSLHGSCGTATAVTVTAV